MVKELKLIGGPAYDDPGDEFTHGLYLKPGYTITSRGHIEAVFNMLKEQHKRPRFIGGFEAKLMKPWPWIAERLRELNPKTAYFAYDTPDDYEPLVEACKMLKTAGAFINIGRIYMCYVLVGYKDDTISQAEIRLNRVLSLGLMPMAMLYNKAVNREDKDIWIKFQMVDFYVKELQKLKEDRKVKKNYWQYGSILITEKNFFKKKIKKSKKIVDKKVYYGYIDNIRS